jgi:hypothetical protein
MDSEPGKLRPFGLTVSFLVGLTACQQPITGPTGTQVDTSRIPGSAATLQIDPQYLLTTRGDYVLSSPPAGVEISLGSKQVRRVGWNDAAAAQGSASVDETD